MLQMQLTGQGLPVSDIGFIGGGMAEDGKVPVGKTRSSLSGMTLVEMRDIQFSSAMEVLVLPWFFQQKMKLLSHGLMQLGGMASVGGSSQHSPLDM